MYEKGKQKHVHVIFIVRYMQKYLHNFTLYILKEKKTFQVQKIVNQFALIYGLKNNFEV